MSKMKTAKELYEISRGQTPEAVAKILDGVREHIIHRCLQEAKTGATSYTIYLKQGYIHIKDELLKQCIELVKEFEENGYKVMITNGLSSYYVNFSITFSWSGKLKPKAVHTFDPDEILYSTESET